MRKDRIRRTLQLRFQISLDEQEAGLSTLFAAHAGPVLYVAVSLPLDSMAKITSAKWFPARIWLAVTNIRLSVSKLRHLRTHSAKAHSARLILSRSEFDLRWQSTCTQ